MKILTWNINSIRIRLHLIKKLAEEEKPDIILLQETKVRDEFFPIEAIKELGYDHLFFYGEKSYNGVAILSKLPLHTRFCSDMRGKKDCRHQAAFLDNGVELHNFYIPAGGDIPDRDLNPKFGYKLDYLQATHEWFQANRRASDKMILGGDLNTAPLETDVWSHKQLIKIVSHTPEEVRLHLQWLNHLNWCDVSRFFVPASEKLYSWWSYRNQDWRKSNRGRRLDHIWITQPLITELKNSYIMKDARDWPLTSDHVPVVMELK